MANVLHGQGWRVELRNLRRRGFELDIVATKRQTLIVVEVKFRQQKPDSLATMSNLLSGRKLNALRRGARYVYTLTGGKYDTIRIDLAVVYPDQSQKLAIDYYVNVLN